MGTAEDRHGEIVRALKAVELVTVADLAQSLGTSEVTIRRDLGELEQAGVLRRVRGGAVSTMLRGEEMPFAMRELDRAEAKGRIAATAVRLITDGESVVLDSGTTGLAAAHALGSRMLTVVPLAVNTIAVLATAPRVSLLLPGGTVRPGETSLVGPMVEENLSRLRFDTMLLTCCGLSPRRGVTAYDLQDAAVKRAAMAVSTRTIAMIDSSKFAHTAMAVVCETSAIDVVVTDTDAPPDTVAALRADGIEVHCV
ncbi:DeoR/GlpR family DNA-binding transcription regulator [Nocardia sp. BMG51109]|uniref:DeoR/GlpR family DNA-binding transcription regulator n=1 Tax=Nocardia sp. BMG51109 TaxID=1056816 RepID=UPI0005697DED|nr:DeoR/GlpR family DNA-binding transcription regulator [Nocardia sp. BMG51109]